MKLRMNRAVEQLDIGANEPGTERLVRPQSGQIPPIAPSARPKANGITPARPEDQRGAGDWGCDMGMCSG